MISGLVHTWNEEANIRNCLSCLGWCDEIVVVDMHSQDKTREIASQFTDRIFLHEHLHYADPARQFGVSQTRGDWVFVLDADEMITPELAEFLKKTSQDKNVDVVSTPRKNYIFGKWMKRAGWWPDYQYRFFRKGKLIFSDRVHTHPQLLGKVKRLPAEERFAIIHFNYLDATQFVERLNRYASIEADNMLQAGIKTNAFRAGKSVCGRFFLQYIWQQGFRGGWDGFFLSSAMAFYKLLVHFKNRELVLNEKEQFDPREIYSREAKTVWNMWQERTV